MPTSEAALTFKIRSDSSQARADIIGFRGAVKSELADIGQGFAASTGRVGAFAASLGPAGIALGVVTGASLSAAGAILALANHAAEAGSRFHTLSIETGLSVETLSGLELALIRAGETLEDFSSGVFFMQKNLSEAAEGNKKLKAAFADLGVKDVTAALKDTEGTVRTVLKSLGQLTDVGVRNAKGTEVMGRAYKLLRVFMADTGGDIDKVIEKAREAGLVMSTEAAEAADEFGDQLDELKLRASRLATTIGGELVPEFNKLFRVLNSESQNSASIVGAAFDVIGFKIRDTVNQTIVAIAAMKTAYQAAGILKETGLSGTSVSLVESLFKENVRELLTVANTPSPAADKGTREGGTSRGGGKKAGRDKAAEAERKQIEAELRDEAELHRDFTDELRRAYDRRIVDLDEYVRQTKEGLETHYQIQKQNYDLEEALIKRTVKDKAEQTEKLAELDRKRNASLREYEKARQAIEDEQADKQHAAAEARRDALLKVFESGARARIAAVERVVGLGVKKESEAAAEVGKIQLDLHDKQTARLAARLLQEETNSAEYRRIQGELGAAEIERAEIVEEVAHRVTLAKKRETEAERQRLEELRRMRSQARAEGIEIEADAVRFAARSDAYRTRAERVATIRQLADLGRRAERERNADELANIEEKKRLNLERAKTEAERVEALKLYHAEIENEERRHQLALGDIGQRQKEDEEAENPFKAFKDLWEEFKGQSANANDSITDSVEGLAGSVVDSLHSMTDAFREGIAAHYLYGESLGLALKKALAAQLANLAAEFTMQGIKHALYAAGSLAFGNFAAAAKHAAVSAAFFAAAKLTGAAAGGLAQSAGLRGNGASAGQAVASTATPNNQTFNYGGNSIATPASSELAGGSRGGVGNMIMRLVEQVKDAHRQNAAMSAKLDSTLSRIQSMPPGQVVTMGAPDAREAIGVAVLQHSGADDSFNDGLARNMRVA